MGKQYLYQSPQMGSAQYAAFFGALIGWIFDYYEVFLLSFLIILVGKTFHLSAAQEAVAFSVQLGFLALGGIVFGVLGDKLGRRRMLIYTVVIYGVGTLARAVAFDYSWLLIWTAVAGFGIGGEYGVGQALVSEVVPPAQRGFWSGLLYGGIFIGIMLGALIGGYVAPAIGWRLTFALSAIPAFIAAYIRLKTPESDVWKNRINQGQQQFHILATRKFWKPFLLCLVAAILQFFAYYGITEFLPTYLVSQHFSMGASAWWLFFTGFAGLVGSIVGAITADRWGRRITLSYLGFSAAIGGFILFLVWHSMLRSPWILVPFFVLFFGSNGATVFGSLFSELFPVDIRSTGVSWALQIGRGLAFIPPLITAAIFPVYGYAPIILIGAAEFAALGLWAWVFPETRHMVLDEDVTSGTDASA